MASINVSQEVDYEGYSSEYAYAIISWDEGPEVTVTITASNVATWRIRGKGSDTTQYYVGTGGTTSGTFDAEDGKSYAFQIYSNVYKTYSDGAFFTVDFGGDDDSGGSSGGSSSGYLKLELYEGEGTWLEVTRTWTNNAEDNTKLGNGSSVAIKHDVLKIEAFAEDGYDLDYYYVQGLSYPYKVIGLQVHGTEYGRFIIPENSASDPQIYTTAKLKEYELHTTLGEGSYIRINRISSEKEGASSGLLGSEDTIYHFDKLEFIVGTEAGYDILDTVISGCTENSDGTFTVVGEPTVVVMTELLGLVYIDDGTTFVPCLIYIDNGTSWDMCIPYIDNGTSWDICS